MFLFQHWRDLVRPRYEVKFVAPTHILRKTSKTLCLFLDLLYNLAVSKKSQAFPSSPWQNMCDGEKRQTNQLGLFWSNLFIFD